MAHSPTAAGLAIKQPSVVRDAEPAGHGRDPPVVGSDLNRSKGWANNSRARTVGGRNAIEVRFNAKNEIAELIVESELASSDECALVVYIAEAQAEESVGQITFAPGSAKVGADVESSPTERGRQIDCRRNWTRIRRHIQRHSQPSTLPATPTTRRSHKKTSAWLSPTSRIGPDESL